MGSGKLIPDQLIGKRAFHDLYQKEGEDNIMSSSGLLIRFRIKNKKSKKINKYGIRSTVTKM